MKNAQIAAIRALGQLPDARDRTVTALTAILDREPPPHPRRAKGAGDRPQRHERYELALGVTGASINTLAELRAEAATGSLVLAMYRFPELLQQLRRALVASGPGAVDELRKILRGQHAAVNQLFAAGQLDRDCGDDGAAACQPVSAMDYCAAVALGGFHDGSAVPELLAALQRPAAPAYIIDDAPGPSQHLAILDALRKIGAPAAARPCARCGPIASRSSGPAPRRSRRTRSWPRPYPRPRRAMPPPSRLACYAASLRLTPDEAAGNVAPYIKDVAAWPPEEKRDLTDAAVERAVLELGRRGPQAQEHTAALLDQLAEFARLATDRRRLGQIILLALPRIARPPCATCVERLDLAIAAAADKRALAELTFEARLLRTYFAPAATK